MQNENGLVTNKVEQAVLQALASPEEALADFLFVVSVLWGIYVAVTYMKVWEAQLDLPDSWWVSDWKLRQALPKDQLGEPLPND